ncbi:MAG: hypothetical protein C7B46_19455 [Sulfobacillus benefaciens]|uniref:Uncharacterized protein n=1 Tax=Sulfobacillus benefaciens TaxID=453960 RepID=A0A2T2WYS1_9FIRM|nr:MAG: hypothetical protein C7B46_19455 [Sulfobacillus benefaciens]
MRLAVLGIPLIANGAMAVILWAHAGPSVPTGYWVGIGGLVCFGVLPIAVMLSVEYSALTRVRRRWQRRRIRVMTPKRHRIPPPT